MTVKSLRILTYEIFSKLCKTNPIFPIFRLKTPISQKTNPIQSQFNPKQTQFKANFVNLTGANFTYPQSRADKIALKIYPFDINCPIEYMIFGITLWLI
jgi:hypothetical protein